MASPPPNRIAAEQQLLPDEIPEDIFLRINSGYDLARASATCRAFRRVATGRLFLRRFLSLHPPPIVGFNEFRKNRGLIQAEPPHRSAPAARAVAQAGDFLFSFVPGACPPNSSSCCTRTSPFWRARDARDGRFLLSRQGTVATDLQELVVCDPLYRRYVQIPPIPRDLVPRVLSIDEMESQPFLAPVDKEESEEHSQFRVIYNWLSIYKVISFVFSSVTGKWCCATSFSFLPARLILDPTHCVRYYACSCFFWACRWEEQYMLMLDTREMKFSFVELLRNSNGPSKQQVVIIDAADDRLGLLTLNRRTLNLYSRTCQNNVVGKEDWRHDNSIPLPEGYIYYIIFAAEGYLLLKGSPIPSSLPVGSPNPSSLAVLKKQCFVVDLKTLLVERLCELDEENYGAHPYASFPPPLALPSL